MHTIFYNEIGNDCVFKGGTSLSKCFKMIDRFSEDIDLVVLRREGEPNNKLSKKLKKIAEVVSEVLPEINIEELTRKMGMNRKTAHTYNKEFQGNYGQVRDVIVLEATWLGYYKPFTTKLINSYIGEMMLNSGQTNMAEEYGMLPFEVRVLEPTRTLCEKIMSLVRFSYGKNPIDDLKKKIRHTYDLHQLLSQKDISEFFYSNAFEEMLLKVANDDVASYKNNNEWLKKHPKDALIFKDLDALWNELKQIYNGDFKNLVYGDFPKEEEIYATLTKIKSRLSGLKWAGIIDLQTSEFD